MTDMSLYSTIPFGDESAMKDFLLSNSQSHSQVADALEKMGSPVSISPIADTGDNMETWLDLHNQIHQNEFLQLGLVGLPDLSDVDLKNEQEFHDWNELHVLAHQTVNQYLGLV